MDAEHFEAIVGRVLDALPAPLATRVADIAVVVEEEPTAQDRRVYGTDGVLLGRYSGVALPRRRVRGRSSIARMPDLIKLYQGPIERACDGDETCIAHLIEETLHREIGRYFGIPYAST
ncbi:MAG: metallopeptidase family protein [Chloroflexia bacterium]|nr:metallopeptidase family protein [Chloroflexia bacterium]